MTNPDSEWQQGVTAPRDGTIFLAWNGTRMAVVNWVPDKPPGVWQYSNYFRSWMGYPIGAFEDFDFWRPLPSPPPGY